MPICTQSKTPPPSPSENSVVQLEPAPSKKLLALMENSEADRKRFWSKVEITNECWNWIAAKSSKGYGEFSLSCVAVKAHRASYFWANGKLPDNLLVCHRCDNPACVRPDHLFLGTNTDNMRDAGAKGRLTGQAVTHCPKGHEYTPENTYYSRGGKNRSCKACSQVYDRKKCERLRERNAAALEEQKRLGIVSPDAKRIKKGTA
jgi:hypothetical protein